MKSRVVCHSCMKWIFTRVQTFAKFADVHNWEFNMLIDAYYHSWVHFRVFSQQMGKFVTYWLRLIDLYCQCLHPLSDSIGRYKKCCENIDSDPISKKRRKRLMSWVAYPRRVSHTDGCYCLQFAFIKTTKMLKVIFILVSNVALADTAVILD